MTYRSGGKAQGRHHFETSWLWSQSKLSLPSFLLIHSTSRLLTPWNITTVIDNLHFILPGHMPVPCNVLETSSCIGIWVGIFTFLSPILTTVTATHHWISPLHSSLGTHTYVNLDLALSSEALGYIWGIIGFLINVKMMLIWLSVSQSWAG